MNASKDDAEHNAGGDAGGRMPGAAEAAALHERAAAVLRVLDEAAKEARGTGGGASPRIVEKYRPSLAQAMIALGDTLADVFEESGGPVDLKRLRSEFLEPILTITRRVPFFQRVMTWATDQQDVAELQEIIVNRRSTGFDAQSLLLSDYYQQTPGASVMRTRVVGAMRLLRDEMMARGAFEGKQVRVLVLGAASVAGLDAAAARHEIPDEAGRVSASVLIVDPLAHALRRVRQRVEAAFGIRVKVLLCSPVELSRHPSRPAEPFDIVYALTQYDSLSPDDALAFTKSIASFVKPGGALLTSCYLPDIPRTARALTLAFVRRPIEYWDEAKWKDMLSALPFDVGASRFEVHPPGALVVLARRKQEGIW